MNQLEIGLPVEKQLTLLQSEQSYVHLVRPAVEGDGIIRLSEENQTACIHAYNSSNVSVEKFVPASGAASRMFTPFIELSSSVRTVLDTSIRQFPFFDKWLELCQKHGLLNFPDDLNSEAFSLLLSKNGLGYSGLPKGIIPFHQYGNECRTAFEEHIVEAQTYAEKGGQVNLHFTVPTDSLEDISTHLEAYTSAHGVTAHAGLSVQNPETNTIVMSEDGMPLTDDSGVKQTRPGGHGALLHNLNQLNSEIVFIKNIDNVVREENLNVQAHWKKVLAGKLIQLRDRIFNIVKDLESGNLSSLDAVKEWMKTEFYGDYSGLSPKDLLEILDRPLRVCGMVKNEGQPGGGPFFISEDGKESLQIVESAEMQLTDSEQKSIAQHATHFNPVDIVCSFKNYKGDSYDLTKYVNQNRCFTSSKMLDASPVKILELPGLWNGSMAYWNTVFIEVPSETFNPVKTVMDLLKRSHQPLDD